MIGSAAVDCSVDGCAPEATDYGPDEADFSIALYSPQSGEYNVCFTDADMTSWVAIPTAAARFLKVAPVDDTSVRGLFHEQRGSLRAGAFGTLVLAGFRMTAPNDASVALVSGGCRAAAADASV